MKEYQHTTPKETLQKTIADGMATQEEIDRFTGLVSKALKGSEVLSDAISAQKTINGAMPTPPSWRVIELELSDVPEYLERGGFKFAGLVISTDGQTFTDEAGQDYELRIPAEVKEAIRSQNEAKRRADYDAEVNKRFAELEADLLKNLQNSPNPDRGRLNILKRWERILEADDTEGFTANEKDLNTASKDIDEGFRYLGGEPDYSKRKRFGTLRPLIFPSNLFTIHRVDKQLRKVYTDAEAAQRFLKWLGQPAQADTPPQGRKASTGAANGPLSYAEVALILAYEKISVTSKAEAKEHGAKYGRMTATNSDLQLLEACMEVFSKEERLAPLKVENNGRQVKPLKRKLDKIEPHLSASAKPLLEEERKKVSEYLKKLNNRGL